MPSVLAVVLYERAKSKAKITTTRHNLYTNRPVKLKSVPHLDPCMDVDGRILLATTVKDPHTVDKLLAACQTSLDPTEY